MNEGFEEWAEILKSDPRFTIASYSFIQETLARAAQLGVADARAELFAADDPNGLRAHEGHITGQELCEVAVDYAVERYGFMAKEVLHQLGIRKTGDLGDLVYNMIRFGLVSQAENDTREDFDDVFDLGAELKRRFRFTYKDSTSRD